MYVNPKCFKVTLGKLFSTYVQDFHSTLRKKRLTIWHWNKFALACKLGRIHDFEKVGAGAKRTNFFFCTQVRNCFAPSPLFAFLPYWTKFNFYITTSNRNGGVSLGWRDVNRQFFCTQSCTWVRKWKVGAKPKVGARHPQGPPCVRLWSDITPR